MGLQCRHNRPRKRDIEGLAVSTGKARRIAAHSKLRIEASSLTRGNAHEVWETSPLLRPERGGAGEDPYLELNTARPLRKVDEVEQVIVHFPMESAATSSAGSETP